MRKSTWYWRIWWWFGYHGLYQIGWWWKRLGEQEKPKVVEGHQPDEYEMSENYHRHDKQ